MTSAFVSRSDLREAVRKLELSNRPVCVHSSLRSFGWVEDGPDAVIDAFLLEGCTLLVPTFTYDYNVAPPEGDRPLRNGGLEDEALPEPNPSLFFVPESQTLSRGDMGAIPAAVLERDGRVRGSHPLNSFCAVGPDSGLLITGQTPTNVYAPLEQLSTMGGVVVLMGVGLECMTLIHYAETLAGRRLFIHWAVGPDGRIIRVLCGGCSNGFPNLDDTLAAIEQRTLAGSSLWRAYPASAAAEAARAAILAEPEITRCIASCRRCNDAILGGPIG